jgi:hypothetical protein
VNVAPVSNSFQRFVQDLKNQNHAATVSARLRVGFHKKQFGLTREISDGYEIAPLNRRKQAQESQKKIGFAVQSFGEAIWRINP